MRKSVLLLVLFFNFIFLPVSFAAFPVAAKLSVEASYKAKKFSLLPSLTKYVPAMSTAGNNRNNQKCMLSKIGRGTMIAGGGLVVLAIIYSSIASSGSTGFGIFLMGVFTVLVGGCLAIVGGIYNLATNRTGVSVVAPKSNEIGLAYNF